MVLLAATTAFTSYLIPSGNQKREGERSTKSHEITLKAGSFVLIRVASWIVMVPRLFCNLLLLQDLWLRIGDRKAEVKRLDKQIRVMFNQVCLLRSFWQQ